VKSSIRWTLVFVLLGWSVLPVCAAFTSFHVFGDSLSTTAGSPAPAPTQYFYGKRYSNGRVWVEVLAQMEGLPFDPTNGNPHSYFGNTSTNLLAQINAYTPPSDASNALVVIWVNNADLFFPATATTPSLADFANAINFALTNQFKAITNLYGKGIRTLVMPNVVDISTIPQFNNDTTDKNLFHQAATNYNAAFYDMLSVARTNCPGLNIVVPDFFNLLADLLAHPASYGVTNTLYDQGNGPLSIDAVTYFAGILNQSLTLNGKGTNFVFWDPTDPTAKVHYIMAGVAQQMIAPVRIAKLTPFSGSNRLDLVNVPLYTNVPLNGLVLSRTNLILGNWTTNLAFSTTNLAQSVWVTNNGPRAFYRLKFPYAWAWP
jgi:phospholipase/lecithinase/hemolysin